MGLITVQAQGVVLMKIAVTSSGQYVYDMANEIRRLGRVPTVDEAFSLAVRTQFGSYRNRVIITPTQEKYLGEGSIDPRFRETLQEPRHHPLCDNGRTEHTVVVNF